jgi:cell division protease FtsH
VSEPPSLSIDQFAASFRAFLDAVNADAGNNTLLSRLTAHLGLDARTAPVLAEEFASYEHPTLQRALDELLSAPGSTHDRIGLAGPNKRYMNTTYSDLLSGTHLTEGAVDWVNVHLADGEVLACVQSGLFLVRDADGSPCAVFVSGARDGSLDSNIRVEVSAPDTAAAEVVLGRLRDGMRRLDVYRGHVLSLSTSPVFGPRGPNAVITFHERGRIERADVVLPDGILERIERHTVVFSEYAHDLRASGRSLRRGILLYGSPGVGKTLTVRYLCSRLPDRTVLLLTGVALGALGAVSRLARRLAPSMVVLEDVDLIAEERTMRGRSANHSLLFELLNEMDGLRDDTDVIYVLTTNRPDLLEPALALRPGRVDLTVELPIPDAAGRRRLFELYARGVDTSDVDWEPYVTRCEGVSPAYVKELLRQACLRAAEAGRPTRFETSDLDGAMEDLAAGGELAQRILGGVSDAPAGAPAPTAISAPMVAGFPTSSLIIRHTP